MIRSTRLSLFLLLSLTFCYAQTARFPSAVATNTDLTDMTDRAQSTLSASMTSGATSFTVVSGTKFAANQILTIDSEQVKVCSVVSNTINVGHASCPNADGRGFAGTTAASHANASTVSNFVTAYSFKAAREEIKAIETSLGANLANVTSLFPNPVPVDKGGTNATTAAGARTNLSAAGSGANSDITSLSALSTPLSVAQGGTAGATASAARSSLSAASSGANSDITSLSALSTPLSSAQGGTGTASPTAHTVPVANGTSAYTFVTPSTAGKLLRSNGTGIDPSFENPPYQPVLNWSQTPSGSLSIGSNTVTLTPCPAGVAGANTNHWVYLSGPSAASTVAVSTATNNTGVTAVTVTTAAPHGLTTGNIVAMSGMSNPQANGTFAVVVTGASTFTLLNSVTNIYIARATNTSPIVVTTHAGDTTDHGFQTGDTVVISNVLGNTAANGTWVITRLSSDTFSLNGSTGNADYGFSPDAHMAGTYTSSSGIVTYGPESVLITGGTCTSGASSGTITFTAANTHSAGYTIQSATAGAAEAIVVATANGVKGVQIPAGASTWYAGVVLPSTFELRGFAGASVITLAAGTPKVDLISSTGTVASSTTSTTALTEANRSLTLTRSFTVASASGLAAGDLLLLSSSFVGGGYYTQANYIRAISGTTLTMKAPIMIPLDTAQTGNVQKLTPVTNVVIRDLVLDGGTSQGSNQSTGAAIDVWAINLTYAKDSLVENVQFRNWTRDGALHLYAGHGNRASKLSVTNSGTTAYNDLSFYLQTNLQVSDIDSNEASGFGPGFYDGTNAQVTNLRVDGPRCRALKLSSAGFSEFSNITLTGSRYLTGLEISGGTYQTKFSNVISTDHAFDGVQTFGDGNQYLTFTGVTSVSNDWYAMACCDSANSVQLGTGDHHITMRDVISDGYVADFGTENSLGMAPLRARVYNSAVQSIPDAAFTAVTFNSETEDVGGLHSTSVNTSRLTLPIWAGGNTANGFPGGITSYGATYSICGQVAFASNATGQRAIAILLNGATTLSNQQMITNSVASATTVVAACTMARLAAGDYVQLMAYQDRGGALNTVAGDAATYLSITRMY